MVVLKKQKVKIEKDGQYSLLVIFGKNNKIRIPVHLDTLIWKDKNTHEHGKGKSILKHLSTMDKKHQIKESGERNQCEVLLERGGMTESPLFKDEYVIKHTHLVFRKTHTT